jgi:hypothetical protein
METARKNWTANAEAWRATMPALLTPALRQQWMDYLIDAGQRAVLFADAMRERGNCFVAHEEGSNQSVLSWDHETIVDGRTLKRPVNYSLVRILPPEGVQVRENGRPYIIIERLSPSNTWWRKYYDLWDKIDAEVPRFVAFERWWGSFYYMTEAEISWIVENLFVGNRLGRGQAHLDERTHVDLRAINSPIIVFASHGDNITPPRQALGWIDDAYKDVEEIKAHGQRILYTLHPSVGHLGIFVSSSIAKKEHREIVSTLKAIEALAPGLLLWAAPPVQALGERLSRRISDAPQEDLRALVSVQDALDRIEQGGFAEGVIRMLIFLAHSRKEVRRSRLERSNRMLEATAPFASMKPKQRTRLIHRESLIVGFEPEAALAALPTLIATPEERARALALCWEIAGPREEMSQATLDMMSRLATILGGEPDTGGDRSKAVTQAA